MLISVSPSVSGRIVRLTMICLSIVIIAGCGPNYREYWRGNVMLTAVINRDEVTYRNVFIGTPDEPFDEHLDRYKNIVVELSDGEFVALSDLNVNNLEGLASKVRNLDDLGYNTPWPKATKKLTVNSRLFFTVNRDQILEFYASSVGFQEGERAPRFGKKDSNKLYSMPFSVSVPRTAGAAVAGGVELRWVAGEG